LIDPTVFWLALLGAVSAGLAYFRFVVLPSQNEQRLKSSVRAFGRAVELRFPNHAGLTEVVCRMALRVGKRLGFAPRRIQALEMAIRLRDIGLCAIPYRLVNRRSWTEWTLSESSTYDCHAEVGGAILETIPELSKYAPTVRNHHASYASETDHADRRLPSLEARIVKGCAEFVWYSRHLGHDTAVSLIEQGTGTLYDPLVAREILRLARASEAPKLP